MTDAAASDRRIPEAVRPVRWPAITAMVLAAGQALVSGYWALGGTVGISTVGGTIETMARSGDARATLLASGATAVKAAGVLFALALIARWGERPPRRLLLVLGWIGAGILTLYGAALTAVGLLAVTGIITIPPDADRYALTWHLAFWDPLFLVWGLALGLAVLMFQRRTRSSR